MPRSRLRSRLMLLSRAMLLVAILCANAIGPQPVTAASGDELIFGLLQRAAGADSPDIGPLDGELAGAAGEQALSVVGIGSRDFALRFICLPRIESEGDIADCGVAFRRNTAGQSLLFTLDTDGGWSYGVTGEPAVQTGEAPPLTGAPAPSAIIELFAIGLTGYVGLNGSYLATLDVSLIAAGGALAVGTGFTTQNTSSHMDYQNLVVWSFDDAAFPDLPESPADPAAQFASLLESITANDPEAGPHEGLLIHAEGRATFSRTGVHSSDVAVHLECGPPTADPVPMWDCGIVFRLGEAVDDQLRLILLSSGRWILAKGTDITIQDGFFEPPSGDADTRLQIDLVAAGQTGWLGINGAFAGTLDLSLLSAPGDVAAASAFFGSTYVPGGSTSFQQFTVWNIEPAVIESLAAPQPGGTPSPIDPAIDSDARLFAVLIAAATSDAPVFGPESGVLSHDPSAVSLVSSSLELADLAARLQCVAPDDAGSRLWDCGIILRSASSDTQLRLVVVSDGFWSLRTGAAEVVAEGSGLDVDSIPGSIVTLDMLALGGDGFFAVNDVFVARLDLSDVPGAGDILAGTAFFNETYADGGSTRYDQFSIWSIADLPQASPVAGTPIVDAASPVPAVDPPAATPEPGGSPSALNGIRAVEPPGQATAFLEPVDGDAMRGYGVITRVARSIDVAVLVAHAEPGDLVVIQRGACGQLSDNPEQIEVVGELDEHGIIAARLSVRLTQILNFGPHSLVVYAAADDGYADPLACGELVPG